MKFHTFSFKGEKSEQLKNFKLYIFFLGLLTFSILFKTEISSKAAPPLQNEEDKQPPVVKVISPKTGDKAKGGKNIIVQFFSTDNVEVVSQEIQFSSDGVNFIRLVSGIEGDSSSSPAILPKINTKSAVIKVIATDAAGNVGEGISEPFEVKKKKN